MSWRPSGNPKIVPRRGYLHIGVAFQGEWTSLKKNTREGFRTNVVFLHLKIYKINLAAWSFLKSAATEGVPSLFQSRIHPCPHPVTAKPQEGACGVSPDVPRLLLSAANHPEQIPAEHQRVSCWKNDTIPFYPGCCHRSCRISCFLQRGHAENSPSTEMPGRAKAAPTNSCTQVKIRILPQWDRKTHLRDRITLFLYFSTDRGRSSACSPLPYRESTSSREHEAGMFYLSLLRHGWKIPSGECLRCQCFHLCLQAMAVNPSSFPPPASNGAPARRGIVKSIRFHIHGQSSDPK